MSWLVADKKVIMKKILLAMLWVSIIGFFFNGCSDITGEDLSEIDLSDISIKSEITIKSETADSIPGDSKPEVEDSVSGDVDPEVIVPPQVVNNRKVVLNIAHTSEGKIISQNREFNFTSDTALVINIIPRGGYDVKGFACGLGRYSMNSPIKNVNRYPMSGSHLFKVPQVSEFKVIPNVSTYIQVEVLIFYMGREESFGRYKIIGK